MPDRLGKYELLGELGAGGMAVVYRARDAGLDRILALKVINQRFQGNEEAKKRFLREAQAAANLNHPNIITVYELGLADGYPFIAMEYLPGKDLSELVVRPSSLQLVQKVHLALQVARALAHAHANGILHRDIKPHNIRVTPRGVAKLMDFGIAKLMTDDGTSLTRTGDVFGTLSYMSPEQLTGQELTHASDVFSFGVLLYEMLSGRRPFEGPSREATLYRIVHAEPSPLDEPELPAELVELVSGCLRKSAGQRPAGFRPLVRRLSRIRRKLRAQGRRGRRAPAPPTADAGGDAVPVPRSDSSLPTQDLVTLRLDVSEVPAPARDTSGRLPAVAGVVEAARAAAPAPGQRPDSAALGQRPDSDEAPAASRPAQGLAGASPAASTPPARPVSRQAQDPAEFLSLAGYAPDPARRSRWPWLVLLLLGLSGLGAALAWKYGLPDLTGLWRRVVQTAQRASSALSGAPVQADTMDKARPAATPSPTRGASPATSRGRALPAPRPRSEAPASRTTVLEREFLDRGRGLGSVLVRTSPPASFRIDDGVAVETPTSRISLPAGTYRLKIFRDGYRSIESEVRIAEGEAQTLDFTLEPQR